MELFLAVIAFIVAIGLACLAGWFMNRGKRDEALVVFYSAGLAIFGMILMIDKHFH